MAENDPMLPTNAELRLAIEQYLRKAYGGQVPPSADQQFMPSEDADPAVWLMRDTVERDPANASLDQVRSFALRVGNRHYPHMKIRLTRAPRQRFFVFSVDAHDAVLHAPPGSPDAATLAQLKRFNAQLAQEILAVWDAAGLLTERAYLRQQIRQAKQRKVDVEKPL